MRNCKRTFKGLAMGWADYKKTCDMVPCGTCEITGQRKETPVS